MSLTKQTITDKIETLSLNSGSHYVLQVREANQILEKGSSNLELLIKEVEQLDCDRIKILNDNKDYIINLFKSDESKMAYADELILENKEKASEMKMNGLKRLSPAEFKKLEKKYK